MSLTVYCFYNNKGGVGKTTLCQNAAALYAELHPETRVLVIDMCPQANISQFLLGGGHIGYKKTQELQTVASRKNVVGFIDWLLRGNSGFNTPNTNYSIQVAKVNPQIPDNVYLIAGDNFLESLSLALNYAIINPANLQAWSEYMTALRRLCMHEHSSSSRYLKTTVFIDCNPSFSVYTQMALLSSDRLIVPMMADFTSIEGIKSIFSMLYGKYPTSAMQRYASNVITFAKQVDHFALKPPQIWEFVFNNYTVNLGVAGAYEALRNELTDFCYNQYNSFPELFATLGEPVTTLEEWAAGYVSDVKDFHTAGKISATLGIPLHDLPQRSSYTMPDTTVVSLPERNYTQAVKDIREFVDKIY